VEEVPEGGIGEEKRMPERSSSSQGPGANGEHDPPSGFVNALTQVLNSVQFGLVQGVGPYVATTAEAPAPTLVAGYQAGLALGQALREQLSGQSDGAEPQEEPVPPQAAAPPPAKSAAPAPAAKAKAKAGAQPVPQQGGVQQPAGPTQTDLQIVLDASSGVRADVPPTYQGRDRKLYAVYQPEQPTDYTGLYFVVWDTVRSFHPGVRAKAFAATQAGEREGRQWLWDHRHLAGAIRAIQYPDSQ